MHHHLRMLRLTLMLCLIPALSMAACPDGNDLADERARLHTELLKSDTEAQAKGIADAIWRIWLTAPDATAQDLLDRGMQRRQVYALEESERILDDLISYCPTYTEAYNQRAFTRFLRTRLDEALADIEVVLSRNPYHFGALSGKALTLMQMGRAELAQDALRQAVKVHPFLRERAMLREPVDPI